MNNAEKGLKYLNQKEFDKALKFLERAKKERPDDPAVWLNLSAGYYATNRLRNGLSAAKKALALYPNWGLALNNIGLYSHKLNKPTEAIAWFKAAGDNKYVDGYFNYALSLLKNNIHDKEGWKYYIYRFFRTEPVKLSTCLAKAWTPGMDVEATGKLLLQAEQGFGDLFNFSRYAYHLQSLGYDVTLQCFNELLDMFPGMKVTNSSAGDYDHVYPLMSLPEHYGVLPVQEGFSVSRGDKVGICWKGSESHSNDANRSIRREAIERKLAGYEIVNLQFGDNPDIKSFSDTLRLASECKVVVTIDSAPLHLCGLHGIDTIALIPSIDSDFRWGLKTEECVWYPTVTLVRDMDLDRMGELVGLKMQ